MTLPLGARILEACTAAGISPVDVIAFHHGLIGIPREDAFIPPQADEGYKDGAVTRLAVLKEYGWPGPGDAPPSIESKS